MKYFYPYSIITPFDAFEIHVFENIMENGAFALGANVPFCIKFSKRIQNFTIIFLDFFQCLKIENDVMI